MKAAARRTVGRPLVAYERRGLRPELSVVMPVYNVAEYLPAALDSVLGQTLRNLEVIAVDDSSTDGCLDILRDYERRDPRVRVLTQPNSGQGPARNRAVALARGEFLTFVDSDDTVPPEAFEYMVRRLRESGSDFSVGSVRRLRNNEFIRTVWARTVHARDRIGVTLEEFPNAMQDIIACNRMFKTSFWREQVGDFRGHIAYEDHVPMLTAYVRAKRFDVLNHVTYNWRIRENKTSTGQQKARLENLLDRIAVKEEAHELLRAEASDFVYDVWVGRTLEVDFPPFIQHALSGPDSYRNLLAATYRTYLERASERALDLVTVRQKVRGHLAAQERWAEIQEADTWFDDVGLVPPAHASDGTVVADPQPTLGFWRDLPEACARLSPLECHFEGVLSRAAFTPSRCTVTGWAVRRALAVRETPALEAWLESPSGERSEVDVRPVQLPEANLWGEQRFAPYDLGGFEVGVDLDALPAGTWHLHVATTYAGVRSEGTLTNRMRFSPVAHASGTTTAAGKAVGRWDAGHGFTLDVVHAPKRPWTPRRSPVEVRGVELGEETLTVVSDAEVSVGNPRVQLPLVAREGDRHTFSLFHETITGARKVVPTARYGVTAGGVSATAEAGFAGTLPTFHHGALVNLDVGVTPEHAVTLAVEAPLPPLTRGASGKRRLRDAYKTMDVEPENAAALTCYRGEFCTDSQLAIDRGLADRYPEVVRYWGVRDWSTEVPEGAVPLLLDSEEWYRALASARFVSHNIDFGAYFTQRPHQRYLQTFHGYPFKSMGIGFWRSKGLTDEKIARAVFKAKREWDTILVPSEEAANWYREQYALEDTDILVAGYPRCDVLVPGNRWVEADEVRARVLGRLGVPLDKTVVLYAPTYRDKLTTRMFAAQRFDELDLDQLARSLGEDHVVMLRGHNNNQRELDRVTGVARVVDVTDWPDVNELTLAADVAVLDYSSLRFDWALTGKPMVFFVPDLEEYFDQREPLFPYEGTAPGPWARTTADVAEALADLPALRSRFAGDIAAFNARFNAHNDGTATDRVLDWAGSQ
ncbi:glycosyltransferase [Nocardioides mangrovicus]|uniref:Glycosyltransferase n=1 Tax=Nocardioides mangrovicus TaxID=2478913 RepID=A0A3L8P5V7_9ACTN|nr:glycosyltransferase [Nocardioides mangrovicus]